MHVKGPLMLGSGRGFLLKEWRREGRAIADGFSTWHLSDVTTYDFIRNFCSPSTTSATKRSSMVFAETVFT